MKKITMILALFASILTLSAKTDKLNVILVMSDDMGYGDLSCNGNPYIQTPNIDKLSEGGYNFRNYHVGTTCTPTRASLMSSMHFNKVGCWHTISGRSIMDRQYKTIADVFHANGYATGMFGKWHLGDNYPYRPFDRGFETTLWFKSGGLTQMSDYWGNDYIDDTFLSGETPVPTKGYCTDVFFDATMSFIEKSMKEKRPFFAYVALNVAHGPHLVEDKYSEKYKGIKNAPPADFCGMADNMDENMGRLADFLKKNGLDKNTIVIYTTDNGTGGGYNGGKGYNAGMQGKKTSNFDGGHRVPFIMNIPNRKGGDVPQLTSCMDVGPSLYEICGIKEDVSKLEGMSFASLLDNPTKPFDRYLVVDTQRKSLMEKDQTFAVLKGNWRYLDGDRLYDITNDVGQKKNIIKDFPEVAKELAAVYEKYWEYVSPENDRMHPLYLATPKDDCVVLSVHDKHLSCLVGQEPLRTTRMAKTDGFWYVYVPEDGTYSFELYRWPLEAKLNIKDAAPAVAKREGYNAPAKEAGGAITNIIGAEVIIGDVKGEASISESANPAFIAVNNLKLKKGEYKLHANFILSGNTAKAKAKNGGAANFVKITKK
ncbi:MAG: arylsulfatase [Opitutales bacterium]